MGSISILQRIYQKRRRHADVQWRGWPIVSLPNIRHDYVFCFFATHFYAHSLSFRRQGTKKVRLSQSLPGKVILI